MQRSVSLAPDLGVTHFYLSHALFYQEDSDPQRALESYNKAIALNAELKDIGYWIEIQEALAEPFITSKEYANAITIYQNTLKELEGDSTLSEGATTYYTRRLYIPLADLYHQNGELDKAITLYEQSLEMTDRWETGFGLMFYNWQCTPVHKKLARVYTEKGNSSKALFHQNRAEELEQKSRIMSSYLTAMSVTIGISVVQLVSVGVVILAAGIYLLIGKRRGTQQPTPSQKGSWNLRNLYPAVKAFFFPSSGVSWGFKDISVIYLLSFCFPVVLLIPIYAIFMTFDLDAWYFSSIRNLVALILLGVLSVFVYWRISTGRFQQKFTEKFPDTNWTSCGKSHAIILLSLWQFFCIVVLNIALVSLIQLIIRKFLWSTI